MINYSGIHLYYIAGWWCVLCCIESKVHGDALHRDARAYAIQRSSLLPFYRCMECVLGWVLLCCCQRHCNRYLDDALNHTIFIPRFGCWYCCHRYCFAICTSTVLFTAKYQWHNIAYNCCNRFSYARIWLASKTLIVGMAFYKGVYANGTQWAWSSAHSSTRLQSFHPSSYPREIHKWQRDASILWRYQLTSINDSGKFHYW